MNRPRPKLWVLVLIVSMAVALSAPTLAQGDVAVTLYVDADSLTIYIPGNVPVSLLGLGFEVGINGQPKDFFLESYDAFTALRFNSLPTPLCLRLERYGSTAPQPIVCQHIPTAVQQLAASDVFWYDAALGGTQLIVLVHGAEQLTFCPAGQSVCNLTYTPPTSTSTLTWTAAPVATSTPTPNNTIPFGSSLDNPVTSNAQWQPYQQTQSFDGVDMVLVPAGCFNMGSTNGKADEEPVNQQCFSTPFWIDRTEVTNGQFAQLGGEAARPSQWIGANQPVENITWFEARDFCAKRGGQLPTEAEWEYAARGPDALLYPWGNGWDQSKVVGYRSSDQGTANVGSLPSGASWVGALDMAGNVWEWTSSLYKPYPYSATDGREDMNNSTDIRVLRGGSWLVKYSDNFRAVFRIRYNPNNWSNDWGFRCARSS